MTLRELRTDTGEARRFAFTQGETTLTPLHLLTVWAARSGRLAKGEALPGFDILRRGALPEPGLFRRRRIKPSIPLKAVLESALRSASTASTESVLRDCLEAGILDDALLILDEQKSSLARQLHVEND